MPVLRLFVQGDRDAKGMSACATQIAALLKAAGVRVTLGAYGQLVKIFIDAGCEATCHGHRSSDRGQCPPDTSFVDCSAYASRILSIEGSGISVSWGLRLGLLLATSDASLFFDGRQGTMLHAVPAIGFGVGQAEKGSPPKKVALVGWSEDHVTGLKLLFFPDGNLPSWIRTFGLNEADQIVHFLTN